MTYIQKWVKADGSLLSVKEYKNLVYEAKTKGIDKDEYFKQQGIVECLSTGEVQEPHMNSAKLVSWYIIDDGVFKMLTFWKYAQYLQESKELGMPIAEYLGNLGFKRFSQYRKVGDEDNPPTRWINIYTSEILFRKEYLKLFKCAKKLNMPMNDFLQIHGYVNLLESKREHIVKK